MFKRTSIFLVSLFTAQAFWLVSGLAQAPDSKNASGRKITASKAELFHGAKKILLMQMFEIKIADEASGTISTDATAMRVNTAADCDCEMIKWQEEDTRPVIKVSVNIKVDDNWITIKANITGDYPKEQISERMIEDDLFNQISRYLE